MGPGDKLKAFMKKFIAPKKNRGMSFEEAKAMYENNPNSYVKSRMEKNLATRDKARDLIKEDARPKGSLSQDMVTKKMGEPDGPTTILYPNPPKRKTKKKKTRHIPTKF